MPPEAAKALTRSFRYFTVKSDFCTILISCIFILMPFESKQIQRMRHLFIRSAQLSFLFPFLGVQISFDIALGRFIKFFIDQDN